jgi:hypothetical protein
MELIELLVHNLTQIGRLRPGEKLAVGGQYLQVYPRTWYQWIHRYNERDDRIKTRGVINTLIATAQMAITGRLGSKEMDSPAARGHLVTTVCRLYAALAAARLGILALKITYVTDQVTVEILSASLKTIDDVLDNTRTELAKYNIVIV